MKKAEDLGVPIAPYFQSKPAVILPLWNSCGYSSSWKECGHWVFKLLIWGENKCWSNQLLKKPALWYWVKVRGKKLGAHRYVLFGLHCADVYNIKKKWISCHCLQILKGLRFLGFPLKRKNKQNLTMHSQWMLLVGQPISS